MTEQISNIVQAHLAAWLCEIGSAREVQARKRRDKLLKKLTPEQRNLVATIGSGLIRAASR